MLVLVHLGIFALVIAALLLVAYIFDWWLPVLAFGIPLAAVLAQLVWRNWWGDRWWRDRFANRNAKPS